MSINATAFADNLLLFATTKRGFQALLDEVTGFLRTCRLDTNPGKCFSISIENNTKQKKSLVIASRVSFKIAGQPIRQLTREDDFKYLGVRFTAVGTCKADPIETLKEDLAKLSAVALKPQQRLHGLRTMVLPALYHRLVL